MAASDAAAGLPGVAGGLPGAAGFPGSAGVAAAPAGCIANTGLGQGFHQSLDDEGLPALVERVAAQLDDPATLLVLGPVLPLRPGTDLVAFALGEVLLHLGPVGRQVVAEPRIHRLDVELDQVGIDVRGVEGLAGLGVRQLVAIAVGRVFRRPLVPVFLDRGLRQVKAVGPGHGVDDEAVQRLPVQLLVVAGDDPLDGLLLLVGLFLLLVERVLLVLNQFDDLVGVEQGTLERLTVLIDGGNSRA